MKVGDLKMCVMKKMIFLAAASLIYITSQAQLSLDKLTGRWISADGGGIEIVDSAKIYLVYGDEKKLISSFHADFSKSPCWLDITLKDGAETVTLKSLLLKVNDDLLQWQLFDDGTRPANFSTDKGEMVYLRKRH
jgi:hypothetical protein